jgi:hypothetical protein
MECFDIQDMHGTWPGHMAEPEKKSYLYLEAHKCMMAK